MERRITEGYRLSPQQRRIWSLSRDGADQSFFAECVIRMDGRLDPLALRSSLDYLAQRWEILRTEFHYLPGMTTPVQAVVDPVNAQIECQDLCGEEECAQDKKTEGVFEESRERSGDLTQAPLLRARLLSLSPDFYQLLIRLPALCSDGASLGRLVEELADAYSIVLQGKRCESQRAQYADLAEWFNEKLESNRVEDRYWRRRNYFSPLAFKLPFERTENSSRAFEPRSISLDIDSGLVAKLAHFLEREAVSQADFLLACWQSLLARITGQSSVIVGLACDGRMYEQIDASFGLFTRYAPASVEIEKNLSFADLLRCSVEAAREAREQQEYFSWDSMDERQDAVGKEAYFPFCFEYLPEPEDRIAEGVVFSLESRRVYIDKFNIKLSCFAGDGSLKTELHYDSGFYARAEIERLGDQFIALLESALTTPGAAATGLRLFSDEEKTRLLTQFNQTKTEFSINNPVQEIIEEQVRLAPDKIAVIFDECHLSYGVLNARANRLAHYLRRKMIGPERAAAICLERSLESVICPLGVLKAGGAYVPLDPNLPLERLTYILGDSQASALITETTSVEFETNGLSVIRVDADADAIASESDENPKPTATVRNLAYILYTSGSTGRPKGVMIEHGSLSNYLNWVNQEVLSVPSKTLPMTTSLTFDAVLKQLLGPLARGEKVWVISEKMIVDPEALLGFIAARNEVVLNCVPSLWKAILETLRSGRLTLPKRSLTALLVGGEQVKQDLIEKSFETLPDLQVWNLYGPTESTANASAARLYAGKSITIGRPIANTEIYIVDEWGQPAATWVSGELQIGGAGLARGYHNRPELTAEKFTPNPFSERPGERLYRSGDLSRRLPDGELDFQGRIDHQVKIRGYRIELGEIEAALSGHPEVREAAAAVVEDPEGEKRLVAFVAAPGASVGQLQEYLVQKLPGHMKPSGILKVESLPLTPNGKLDRKALLELEVKTSEKEEKPVGPRTAVEEILCGIWSRMLGVKEVSIDGNFFELGGHSLLATQMISRVRESLGVEVSLRRVFERGTVRELAEEVERESGRGEKAEEEVSRSEDRENLPLSYSQQRLWFLDQLEPGSWAYNVARAVRLEGELNGPNLEQSLREVSRRHESLRSRIESDGNGARQRVEENERVELRQVDLRGIGERERERAVERLIGEEGRRGFDLSRGPLMRATLLRESVGRQVVLLTMHHIVSDGWSMGVLVKELGELYQSNREGVSSGLEELKYQYGDYAKRQRERLEGENLERQLEYWRKQLAGAPPTLDLTTDFPRPLVQSYRGAQESFGLSPALSASIRELSRSESTTVFMTLLAAFQTLLYRYSGQEDFIVGSPISGRTHLDQERLIGVLLNILAFRANFAGRPTFRQLLSRIRETCLGAYTHQDVPFEKLVEQLHPERQMSRSPLFQIVFALQNAPQAGVAMPGLRATQIGAERTSAKFDLTLIMVEHEGRFIGSFEYCADLFSAETIKRLVCHFENLLTAIIADPDRPAAELPMLSTAETQWLLSDYNHAAPIERETRCLHQLFELQAEDRPDAIALSYEDASLSYGLLNRRANQLAWRLRALGVEPEKRVGLCLERGIEMAVAILAVLKAGGAYVPVEPSQPESRIAYILTDTEAVALLTETAIADKLRPLPLRVFCVDDARESVCGEWDGNPPCEATQENLAYVLYTSGSTGQPKGALITHANVTRLMVATQPWFRFQSDDVWTMFHSYSFDFSVWEFWGALRYGGRLIVVPYWVSRSADLLSKLLAEEPVTVLNQTPSAFRQLIGAVAAGERLALRFVVFGGEALEIQSLRPWLERYGDQRPRLVNMYGITETTVHVTYQPIGWEQLNQEGSPGSVIGVPIPEWRLYTLDRSLGLAALGAPGELFVGGAGLSRGYLNRPELTAQRFLPDALSGEYGARIYRSGDLARFEGGQRLRYIGRIDNQIKIRGFRVELGEIEAALLTHPEIREAAVLVREDHPGNKRLVAYFTFHGKTPPSTGQLQGHLKERLADYMTPSAFVPLDTLPLTVNGKLDRRALPAPQSLRSNLERAYEAPRNQLEATLAKIWMDTLHLEQVGVHDNFFEAGGDSILSIQIVARAKALGILITPKQIFLRQTIEELAQAAQEATIGSATPQDAIGFSPLTPIQRWFFEQDLPEPHYFNQALMFEIHRSVDYTGFSRLIEKLVNHHDALRMRFNREGDQWRQSYSGPVQSADLLYVDFSSLGGERRRKALESAASSLQVSLDLTDGPLFRAALFNLGEELGSRFLLIIHHLVVDGVSWRVLMEDLQLGVEQMSAGTEIALSPKTSTFKEWSERLSEFARSEAVRSEIDYWLGKGRPATFNIPRDAADGANTVEDMRRVSVKLSEEQTRALLQLAPKVFRAQIHEVLAAALGSAIAEWAQTQTVTIDVESHGREDLFEDLDLSRTVGWFTTIYPLSFKLPEGRRIAPRINAVKEAFRGTPSNGIHYGLLRYLAADEKVNEWLREFPSSEICFNYLGQFNQSSSTPSTFRKARESSGSTRCSSGRRKYLLDVSAIVTGGRLEFSLNYSEVIHRRSSIEKLASAMTAFLHSLLEECNSSEAVERSVADFPLLRMESRRFKRLEEQIHRRLGSAEELEDLYPLSPLQQGILFHALYAPNSGMYLNHSCWKLEGEFDETALLRAWRHVIERHAILRTSFLWEELPAPLQVVQRRACLKLKRYDWRELTQTEQEEALQRFLAEDRRDGISLSEAPLMRLSLIQSSEDSTYVVWSYHQLLLDGWSRSLLLNEMLASYEAYRKGKTPELGPVFAFRDYIARLVEADLSAAERFWRQSLDGFNAPTSLPAEKRRNGFLSESADYDQQELCMTREASMDLQALARQHELTLNTIVQGAWSLLLHHYSGEDQVLFGSIVSGRPPDLPGVEAMIGLFINTLPVCVRIRPGEGLRSWLKSLQARQAEAREFEYTPLTQIQQWSDVPPGQGLFESILIFDNFPVAHLKTSQSGGLSNLRVSQTSTLEITNYPLALIVAPYVDLRLRLIYDRSRFQGGRIRDILRRLKALLEAMAANPDLELSSYLTLTAEEQRQLSAGFTVELSAFQDKL
jgi:amino acid adenylation domain-containing protein/non-ribosomal peptide synthase protein (TIGR01720 family)